MIIVFELALILFVFTQDNVDLGISFNGKELTDPMEINLSEFHGSYITCTLKKGDKMDGSLPLSGKIFIRTGNKAVYMADITNLGEKVYFAKMFEDHSKYKLVAGDFLIIRVENVRTSDGNNTMVLNIPFVD